MGNIPKHTILRQCFHWLNVKYRDLFADYRVDKLTTGKAIFLFVEAALASRKSTDGIAAHLKAKKWLQEWLDLESISGSALYRKLEVLPLDLLKDVLQTIYKAIALHYDQKDGIARLGKLSIIDSSEIRLPKVYGTWAYTSSNKNAVKMHTNLLVGDAESVCPEHIILSTADVSDQAVVLDLMTESTNTYVYDRGYINYSNFRRWEKTGTRFVARLKANNKCKLLAKRTLTEPTPVTLDADVELIDPQSKEAFQLRLVEYTYIDNKSKRQKKIRVVTNRWDITAKEVSEIYRYRWKIELFFKWMKQHVNLKKLYNHKTSAVWNQIYLTLIAYALCELIRLTIKPEKTRWFVLRHLLLYADQSVEDWLEAMNAQPTRMSKGRRRKKKLGRPRKHPKVMKPSYIIIK
jgi:hypothetical protein